MLDNTQRASALSPPACSITNIWPFHAILLAIMEKPARASAPGDCRMNAHSGYARAADDWYVEPDWAVRALVAAEATVRPFAGIVLDPCCGAGNVPAQLGDVAGVTPIGTDLRPRAPGVATMDYRESLARHAPDSVISNPPYNQAQLFIEQALEHARDRVCVVLRLGFLAAQKRHAWWPKVPFARLWVSSVRMSMPPGGSDFPASGGSVDYAWFVFEKGHRGSPMVGWLPDVARPPRKRRTPQLAAKTPSPSERAA
ncbi:hypothetical protein CFR75_15820 [Komagataeibacter xylinus]|uniref:SAM-dependent methyltransferase n=2 Tax=Komagataeibacter xylinus TaxID=28448 RepID=A0A318PY59_KOMXY|nr:hypothetical protein CFR75_15820 [Komagataeibacter xylinus]